MNIKFNQQLVKLFLLLFFTLFIVKIHAQETSHRLTLEGCIDYALQNNLKLHQIDAEEMESLYRIKEIKSQLLPQITGSGSLDRNLTIPTLILPGELVGSPKTKIPVQMGTKNVFDFSARIEQVIYDPNLFQGIKMAQTSHEIHQLRRSLSEEEMIYSISYAFYEILGSIEEINDINTMISRQESLSGIVQSKIEKGVSRQVDLNRIHVNINNLKSRKRSIENAVFQQKNYLKTLIGMPLKELFDIEYDFSAFEVKANFMISPSDSNQAELIILEKEKEMISQRIKQERQKYFPTLSGLISGGYQFQSDQLRLTKDPWFHSVALGLRLNIPIFDGFAKRNRIQQLHFQNRHLDFKIKDVEQDIKSNKLDAINQLRTSFESIKEQKQNLLLAEDNYNKTNLLYNEGLIAITEVFDTETTLLDTKIAYTRELIYYKKAQVDLLKTSGKLQILSRKIR